MPRVPDGLLDATVFLYPSEGAARSSEASGATGFLVAVRNGSLMWSYLVTNIHAVTDDVVARVNVRDGGFDLATIHAGAWEKHSDGDDVAVARLDVAPGWANQPLEWDQIYPTTERMVELNVGIGDDVVMVGRFIGHEGRVSNQPVARFGNISLMPGETVLDGRGLRVEAYLVEMRSLPGFSGSPVFIYIGPGSYRGNQKMMPFNSESIGLLGIDTGHKRESTGIYRKGAIKKAPEFEEFEVRQNSGIAIVAPSSKINDLLNAEVFVSERDEQTREWERQQGGELAESDSAETDEFGRFENLARRMVNTPKPKPDEKDESAQ